MGLQQGAGKHFGVTLVWLCHLRRGTTPGGIGPLGTQTLGHPTLPGTPHPSFLATSAPHGTPNPCTPDHRVLISPCTPISLHSAFLGTPALAPRGTQAPPHPLHPNSRSSGGCGAHIPLHPNSHFPRTPNTPEHLRTSPNTSEPRTPPTPNTSEHPRTLPNTPEHPVPLTPPIPAEPPGSPPRTAP